MAVWILLIIFFIWFILIAHSESKNTDRKKREKDLYLWLLNKEQRRVEDGYEVEDEKLRLETVEEEERNWKETQERLYWEYIKEQQRRDKKNNKEKQNNKNKEININNKDNIER